MDCIRVDLNFIIRPCRRTTERHCKCFYRLTETVCACNNWIKKFLLWERWTDIEKSKIDRKLMSGQMPSHQCAKYVACLGATPNAPLSAKIWPNLTQRGDLYYTFSTSAIIINTRGYCGLLKCHFAPFPRGLKNNLIATLALGPQPLLGASNSAFPAPLFPL